MYIRNPSILRWYARIGLALLVLAFVAELVQAQPGGGGGQPALPAFDEPKFRDRVWESGGPRINAADGGKIIVAVEIRGNRTVSEHRILSHMQTRTDRAFDSKQLEADIRELWRTELFESIKPATYDAEGGVVVVL